jgi:hypothetical protein
MLAGYLLAALASTTSGDIDPYLTFIRSPAFDRRVTIVEIGTLDASGADWHYWFRRTVRLGKQKTTSWTETRSCPAGRWVVEEAAKLEPPHLLIPGVRDKAGNDAIIVTADGVAYTVIADMGRYGERLSDGLRFGSNVDTPLAAWVDESLRRLDACWVDERPHR